MADHQDKRRRPAGAGPAKRGKKTVAQVYNETQMRIDRDAAFGRTPNAKDLAIVQACLQIFKVEAGRRNLLRTRRTLSRRVQTRRPAPASALSEKEHQALAEVAARMELEEATQNRSEILQMVRLLAVGCMPRTQKASRAAKGRYKTMFPLGPDNWCEITIMTAAKELPWGQDRLWMMGLQTLALEAGTPLIELRTVKTLLDYFNLARDGEGYESLRSGLKRLLTCAWSYRFASSPDAFDDDDEGAEVLNFFAITEARLPSRKDMEREARGERPLLMGDPNKLPGVPYYIELGEKLWALLNDPKHRLLIPRELVAYVSDSPLALDFWVFVVTWAKRARQPALISEEILLRIFGQGWKRKRALFNDALIPALEALKKLLEGKLDAQFLVEDVPQPGKKGGRPSSQWSLRVFPLKAPIEKIRPLVRKGTLAG